MFFMRLLFAIAIYLSLRVMLPDIFGINQKAAGLASFTEAKSPVGIGHLIDLTFLSDPGVGTALHWIVIPALIAYAAGFVLPVSTLIVFLIHCAIFTLNNSKGATHHGYQILCITLFAQVCVLWAPILLRRLPENFRRYLPRHEPGLHIRDLFTYYSQVAIAGCYVIAGLSKVLRSHVKWIIDSPDVAVQIVKSHSQKYYEYLQPEWSDMGLTYATWIAEHPWLTRLMLTSGLALELFAFLLLINRAWAAFIGISLILMHLAIGEIMGLHFPQNIQGDFALLVNAPFWLFAAALLIGKRQKTALR
ncbi:MAG: hypothetical protein ACI8XO_002198 [Verrucomicrobiales bacterium]